MGRRLGKYELLGRLGVGGMAIVFRAKDTMLGRDVALKVINQRLQADDDLRKRFLNEARVSASLTHSNIVIIHDLGLIDGVLFIAMEYLEGQDLRDLIDQSVELSLRQKINIAIQVGRALQYAHSKGVIHRDVKPGNIRILNNGVVKLMDFGIAMITSQVLSRMTRAGSVVGSPTYMSPEQIRGGDLTNASDVFAFGIVLYELLAYMPPFEGNNPASTVYKILNEPVPPLELPGIPHRLVKLLKRCLEKDVAARYTDFEPILQELVAIKQALSEEAARPVSPPTSHGNMPVSIPVPSPNRSMDSVSLSLAGVVSQWEDEMGFLTAPEGDQTGDGAKPILPESKSHAGNRQKEALWAVDDQGDFQAINTAFFDAAFPDDLLESSGAEKKPEKTGESLGLLDFPNAGSVSGDQFNPVTTAFFDAAFGDDDLPGGEPYAESGSVSGDQFNPVTTAFFDAAFGDGDLPGDEQPSGSGHTGKLGGKLDFSQSDLVGGEQGFNPVTTALLDTAFPDETSAAHFPPKHASSPHPHSAAARSKDPDPYAKAVRLLEAGQLQEARDLLEKLLQMEPDHPEAYFKLEIAKARLADRRDLEGALFQAATLYELGDYEAAISEWERVLDANPGDLHARKGIESARNALSGGTPARLEPIGRSAGSPPSAARSPSARSAAIPQARPPSARFRGGPEPVISGDQSLFDQGKKLYKTGRYDAAADTFERILSQDPNDSDAYFNLELARAKLADLRHIEETRLEARAYATAGDASGALQAWERLLEARPGDSEAEEGLAIAKMALSEARVDEPVLSVREDSLASVETEQVWGEWDLQVGGDETFSEGGGSAGSSTGAGQVKAPSHGAEEQEAELFDLSVGFMEDEDLGNGFSEESEGFDDITFETGQPQASEAESEDDVVFDLGGHSSSASASSPSMSETKPKVTPRPEPDGGKFSEPIVDDPAVKRKLQSLFDEASKLERRGDVAKAFVLYGEILEIVPDNSVAEERRHALESRLQSDKLTRAYMALRRAQKIKDSNPAQALVELHRALSLRPQLDEARVLKKELERFSRRRLLTKRWIPSKPVLAVMGALILVGLWLAFGVVLPQMRAQQLTEILRRASRLATQHRFDDAHVAIRKAKELLPDDPRILRTHGRILLLQGRAPDAVPVLRRLVDGENPTANDRFLLAKSLAESGGEAEARQILQSLISSDQRFFSARREYGWLALEGGELDLAEAQSSYLTRVQSAEPENFYLSGSLAVQRENFEGALNDLERAYELGLRRRAVLDLHLDLLLRFEQYDRAEKLIAANPSLYPDEAEYRLKQGRLAELNNRLEAAATFYQKALLLGGAEERFVLPLAAVLIQQEKYKAAETVLLGFHGKAKPTSKSWEYLGDLNLGLKNCNNAIENYQQALEFKPGDEDLSKKLRQAKRRRRRRCR